MSFVLPMHRPDSHNCDSKESSDSMFEARIWPSWCCLIKSFTVSSLLMFCSSRSCLYSTDDTGIICLSCVPRTRRGSRCLISLLGADVHRHASCRVSPVCVPSGQVDLCAGNRLNHCVKDSRYPQERDNKQEFLSCAVSFVSSVCA